MFRFPTAPLIATACCAVTLHADAALSIVPVADNITFKAQADINQSATSPTLSIKAATGSQINSRTAFLKFSTTGISAAAEGTEAIFTVTNTVNPSDNVSIRIYALNSGVTGYNWLASDSSSGAGDGITWNNSPAFASTSGTNYLDTTKITNIGQFTVAGGTAIGNTFSVTLSNWSNFVQSDGSLTLIAVVYAQSSGSDTLSLGSLENGNASYRPTLTFVPEPSAALMALVGTGLAALRRRR